MSKGEPFTASGKPKLHWRLVILVSVAIIAVAAWFFRDHHRRSEASVAPYSTLHTVLTNPVAAVTNLFRGGIGVVLSTDQPSGRLKVAGIMKDSPAEASGLRTGDIIVTIDGKSAKGLNISQAVEQIRGLAAFQVTLAVERKDHSNLVECVIRRTSWNRLQTLEIGKEK